VKEMSKNLSIIIPISLSDESRIRAFKFVEKFYQQMFPEAELLIGVCNELPFPKAKTINKAVETSTGEILIIADADILIDPLLLRQAVKELETHTWVIPFQRVLNITKESTQELLKVKPQWPLPLKVETRTRQFMGNGGINVVNRKHFEMVGGFDERFVGWGGEDDAFAYSLNHLCGHAKRLDAPVYHLWHERHNTGNYEANVNYLKPYLNGVDSIKEEIKKRKGY
jgi:predicted glycosyltransferase involved in capsule biosynthesis